MSRYYKVVVGDTEWTNSVPRNGGAILNAQTVEFDLVVAPMHVPDADALSFVRVWGPKREQISQASDFNGKTISVYGGMQKGLPLASVQANQSGLLITGIVFAAFGNWQGTNQTIDFVINANGASTPDKPANIVHHWVQGTKLSEAIRSTLQAAFPSYSVEVKISDRLVLSNYDGGVYQTLLQYAKHINGISKSILGGDYSGVFITSNTGAKVIKVTDNSSDATDVTEINGNDLIGQITWLSVSDIQFTTVMRSDLQIGDFVSFPKYVYAQAQTSATSDSQARNALTFTGKFGIGRVQHFGNSRDPDGMSWVSTYQAYMIPPEGK